MLPDGILLARSENICIHAGFWLEGNPLDQLQLHSHLEGLSAKGSKLREIGLSTGQVKLMAPFKQYSV